MTHRASCGLDRTAVYRYRDGDLPEAERRTFEGHLGGCASCRGRLEDGDALGRLLRIRDDALGEELPKDFAAQLMARLPAAKRPGWTRLLGSWHSHRLLWVSAVAVAAALAVLVPLVVRQGAIDRRSAAENEAGLRRRELVAPPVRPQLRPRPQGMFMPSPARPGAGR